MYSKLFVIYRQALQCQGGGKTTDSFISNISSKKGAREKKNDE